MKKTILTKNQKKSVWFKNVIYEGEKVDLRINLRYDDNCGNGHNTFSITGDLYKAGRRSEKALIMCGCIHNIIEAIAPEYKEYIQWHLMSSDKPLHYVANTIYHASRIDKYTYFVYFKDEELNIKPKLLGIYTLGEFNKIQEKYKENVHYDKRADSLNKESNLSSARSTAIAPNATLKQLKSKKWLKARLPQLKKDFILIVESLGFTY